MGKKSKRHGRKKGDDAAKSEPTLTFYHFTRPRTLPVIIQHGLRKGDIPTSSETGFNAVWLTTDPDPHKFKIGLNDADTWEKRKSRIQLVLRKDDPNLKKWTEVADMYKIQEEFYRGLNITGGNSASSWWVYRGKITNESFQAYDLWQPGSRRYEKYTDTNELERSLFAAGHLIVMNSLMDTYPEPEVGWPQRKMVERKCANPNCTIPASSITHMLTCENCQLVQYHSKECQKAHWKLHKSRCKESSRVNQAITDFMRKPVEYKCCNPECQVPPSSFTRMVRCRDCLSVQYHSKECQKAHRNQHMPDCIAHGSLEPKLSPGESFYEVGNHPKSPYHS